MFNTPRDYDTQAHSYQVEVTASDGINTTPKTITVDLTDQNDNAPVITTGAIQSVAENTTLVAALTASDADTVGTNPATFTITGGADQALFAISGGNLVFNAPRDYDTQAHSYQVEVTASDGINTTPKTITVDLTDQNDNAPVITTGAIQSVAENTTLVAALTATDADTVGTNPATFTITGGADQALFAISGGNLVFNTPRDYDTQAHSYQVEVTASDGINTTPKTITVDLTDQNDNAPVITTGAIQSVAENTTFVAALTSTDADTVGTNPATFTITGGADQALFAISGGNLVFNAPRDYDTQAHSYQVEVTASDGINTTPKTITVDLTDQNDNAPVITTGAIQSVAENTTLVAALTSTDADTIGTNPATFTITGGADQALFGISGGNLVFNAPRDYGTQAHSYQVQVTASDGLNTTSQGITVNLTDQKGVTINGTSGNDLIDSTRTVLNQPLPTPEADTINGSGGNDVIAGGAGADTLDGAAGWDTASYATSSSGVTVSLMTGTGSGGDAQGDRLLNIENLVGSNFDDTLEGSTVSGSLDGGLGNDTVSFAHAASGAGGAGVTVNLALTTWQNTITGGWHQLLNFENVTGSEFNDTLIGNFGNDIITGLGGDDTLNGNLGADTMFGGAGNDIYVR